jgi:hypothetical protein
MVRIIKFIRVRNVGDSLFDSSLDFLNNLHMGSGISLHNITALTYSFCRTGSFMVILAPLSESKDSVLSTLTFPSLSNSSTTAS